MISASSISELWETPQHKAEILRLVAKDHFKTLEVATLNLAFVSSSGQRYFTIPERESIPMLRLSRNMEFMKGLSECMTRSEYFEIFDAIDQELSKAFGGKQVSPTKIGALIQKVKDRHESDNMHYDLLLMLTANNLIRHDENPLIVDMGILQQKVDDLDKEVHLGNTSFFFQIPQLKILNEILRLAPDELASYLTGLKREMEKQKKIIQGLVAHSGKKSTTNRSSSTVA